MVMRFSSAAQRGKSLWPVAFAALALAACSHRHDAEPEAYVSIKDQSQTAVPAPVPAVKPSVVKSPLVKSAPRQRLGGHVPTDENRGARPNPRVVSNSDVNNSYVAIPRAPKAQASLKPATEPVKMATRDVSPIVKDVTPKSDAIKVAAPAPQVAAVPMPPVNSPAPIVPKAPAVEPAPAKIAAVPAPTPNPAPPIVTPKVELIPAPMSDASPNNGAAKTQVTKPQAPVVAPKMIAKAADTAPKPSTRTTSLSDQVRIKDALDRADMFLKTGQVPNARALLQDAARGENADLLTALAATYDPIVLVDYPSAAKSADPKRAVELYEVAIAKGSVAAKERMNKLKEKMSKVQ